MLTENHLFYLNSRELEAWRSSDLTVLGSVWKMQQNALLMRHSVVVVKSVGTGL